MPLKTFEEWFDKKYNTTVLHRGVTKNSAGLYYCPYIPLQITNVTNTNNIMIKGSVHAKIFP